MPSVRALLVTALVLGSAAPALALGDVTLEVDGKRTVRLTGDALPNSLEIVPGEGRGVWLVVGTDGTTINGLPEVAVADARGIRVVLNEGDDRVEVKRLTLDRDLRLDMGSESDHAIVRDVIVRGRMSWKGGDGPDRLDVEGGSVLRRSSKLIGNRGDDEIRINDARFLGRVRIRGNRGRDTVLVQNAALVDQARVYVDSGAGGDDVIFDTCKLGEDVWISTGGESDYVLINNCQVHDDFDARLGRDDDRLDLDDTTFHEDVDADGESGRDRIEIYSGVRFRGFEKDPERYDVDFDDFERGG